MLIFGPNRGRNVTFVHPQAWLGSAGSVDRDEALRELFRRYLRAYGPATHQDFSTWWGGGTGVSSSRKLLRSLEDEVEEVEAEGRQAWMLSDDVALLRSLERPKSIHLLPVFDVYTLHYRPRDEFLPPGVYDRIYRTAGWISSVVLVDGAVAGVWESKRRARGAWTCTSSCSCGRRSASAPGSRAARRALGTSSSCRSNCSFRPRRARRAASRRRRSRAR